MRTTRLSSDAALWMLELLHERQGRGLVQYPEFASGQLRKTFGRWDVRTQQHLRKRGDGLSLQSAAKKRRADTPCYDSALLSLPSGLEPQTGELGLGGARLRIPIGLGIDEQLPGNPDEVARGRHDGHVAIFAPE